MGNDTWPALDYDQWAPTKKTLQMCTQMMGKLALATAPPQPQWLHTRLDLTPRGFATGALPYADGRILEARLDLFDSAIELAASDGTRVVVPLGEGRCVADIWAGFSAGLEELGVEADIWTKPQEVTDVTSFPENRHDCTVVPGHAQAYHRLLCTLDGVYEEFRSEFFGRSSIQFWWGAFDFSVLLFDGRKTEAPRDRGYIMRYDLDAVHFNAGFWPGDDSAPYPGFYGYLVPSPEGCEAAPIEPEHAGWVEAMGEWMMPYEAVRSCDDPRAAVLSFLRSIYEVALTHGGWDASAHTYEKPAPPLRG